MRTRSHVSPDDNDTGSVFDTLKRRVRWLVALSLMLGGLTYGALSLGAPRYQSEPESAVVAKGASGALADRSASSGSDLITPRTAKEGISTYLRAMQSPELMGTIARDLNLKKGPLSALITLVSLIFGTAWIVTAALIRKSGKSARLHGPESQAAKPVALLAGPVLPSQPKPLSREVEDGATQIAASEEWEPLVPVFTIPAGDVIALSSRLRDRRRPDGGYRTLLTGAREGIDPTEEVIELARALAYSGSQVILIDWSPSGEGMAERVGLNLSVGLNDLLCGDVNFGAVIQRLPRTSVHAIAAGKALKLSTETINRDQLNLVLDALDEAYEHIIVTGRHDDARGLFEMIEGRFDAGIVVFEPRKGAPVPADPDGTFLGFEVADIDIIRFERRASERAPVQQRIARVAQRRPLPVARRAS